jgi:hypothetical protein
MDFWIDGKDLLVEWILNPDSQAPLGMKIDKGL